MNRKRMFAWVAVVSAVLVIAAIGIATVSDAVAKPPRSCEDTCQYLYDKCVRTTRDQTTCFNNFCDCMCNNCNNCIC